MEQTDYSEVIAAGERLAADRHYCHAYACKEQIPPSRFMCFRHWRQLPKAMQRDVWATYRPGQEIDKQPSAEYLAATRRAILFIAKREVMPIPESYRQYLEGR